MQAVDTKGLSKTFETIEAVKELNLSIESGRMCALVGPDGAGKTTTIRMLCGVIPPTGGAASVLGLDIHKQKKALKHKIGYLSQGFSLYEDLSIDENIEFFAEIHQVENLNSRRQELLDFTRLAPFHNRPAGKLSGGMKKKLALACTLVHRPEIIFLDEPTTGVDPVSRRDFWLILSRVQKEGTSILVSTPYLDEAERCDTVGLLSAGSLLAYDTPDGLRNRMPGTVVELTVSDIRSAGSLLTEYSDRSDNIQIFGDRIDIRTNNAEETKRDTKKILGDEGVEVLSVRDVVPSLENVFISYLQGQRES